LLLFQERRREYSLKSPGIKPQASVSTRHNAVSSQQGISNVINGSLSGGGSTSSMFGSASTLSSRRRVPGSLPPPMTNDSQSLNAVDDEMDMDSLSSGSTPMTTPTTTDSEFNMEDDSSVFKATTSSSTFIIASS